MAVLLELILPTKSVHLHKKDPKHVRQTLNPQSTITSISNSSQTSLCPTVHRSSSFTTNEQIIVLSNNGTFKYRVPKKINTC